MGANPSGFMYHRGLGFAKSSLINCAFGNYMLGSIYHLNGYHAKKDLFRALELFKRLYESGNKAAVAKIIQCLSMACA